MHNFKDLETIGFLVVKNFFNEEEISLMKTDYSFTLTSAKNKNYDISVPSTSLIEKLLPKLNDLIKNIKDNTNILVDIYTNETMFTDNTKINFEWHQDHESYYILQQSYNYINCYIPVIKTNKNVSGLSLIPMNYIKENHGFLFNKIFNKGAQQVNKEENNMLRIYNAETDETYRYKFDIEAASVSPDLSEGDILLIRGDVLHKTQDTNEHRVALSIRFTDGNCFIFKNKIFHLTSNKKRTMIENNLNRYKNILNKFSNLKTDTIKFKDLYK